MAVQRLAIIGTGLIGTSVALAAKRSGSPRVSGFDPDPETIAKLQSGHAPLFEPGLDELLNAGLRAGRLRFTSDRASAIRESGTFPLRGDIRATLVPECISVPSPCRSCFRRSR